MLGMGQKSYAARVNCFSRAGKSPICCSIISTKCCLSEAFHMTFEEFECRNIGQKIKLIK